MCAWPAGAATGRCDRAAARGTAAGELPPEQSTARPRPGNPPPREVPGSHCDGGRRPDGLTGSRRATRRPRTVRGRPPSQDSLLLGDQERYPEPVDLADRPAADPPPGNPPRVGDPSLGLDRTLTTICDQACSTVHDRYP